MKESGRQRSRLISSIRTLLLPITGQLEEDVAATVGETLQEYGVEEEEQPDYLHLHVQKWRESGTVSEPLRSAILGALGLCANDNISQLPRKFFEIHDQLCSDLSFQDSVLLLNKANLAGFLAQELRMSAAKLSSVLANVDKRISHTSWRDVQSLLSKLGIAPSVSQADVEHVHAIDDELESEVFADSTIEDACQLAGNSSRHVGYTVDLESELITLWNRGDVFVPYLQILHYQAMVSSFYDHLATNAYEFSPRGQAALWLFGLYEVADAGNPFLNNAKAVDTLDMNWARSRKKYRSQAEALVRVLGGLDELDYSGGEEVAAIIRRWILRVLKIKKGTLHPITNEEVTVDFITALTRATQESQTQTRGIVEQRIVDYAASSHHLASDGWRNRGIGDSVNANNVSRRKLGDCDFQSPIGKEIFAYEAHGGTLTATYFEEHVRSLARSIVARKDELEGIADIADWRAIVTFVAHKYKIAPPKEMDIAGLRVEFRFVSFVDFLNSVAGSASDIDRFWNFVIAPINESRTPQHVRDTLRAIGQGTPTG